MEQENYKLEIVNELLRGSNHMREIARLLKTNHMRIVREINALEKKNVVDYKQEGKNKVYFLKKTLEAKNYVFTTENYKLHKLLIKYHLLRRIIEEIQKNNKIKLAVIFGSYAKGNPKEDSDIDLYIETEDFNLKKEVKKINTKLSIKIGKYNKSSLLIREIEKNHVIVKGVELYYEKNKFFE